MSNNNNDKYIDEHKDDLLKFSELFFKKNYSENKNNDKQKFIIVGEPAFNSLIDNYYYIEQVNQEWNAVIQKQYEKQYEEQKLPKKKKTFKKEFVYVKRKFI